jgi:hypothetical protein
MKRILVILGWMVACTSLAIVGPGKAQVVTILRDTKQALVFRLDNGKTFSDVDSCAEHCWNRSGSITTNSPYSNLVTIHIQIDFSQEDRQYVGDRFVENMVYPNELIWIENGATNRAPYRPDSKSFGKKKELK